MRPFQALSLDLDDTLLDGSRFQESIVRTCRMIAEIQPGLDANRLAEANRQVWQSYWPEVEHKWTLGKLDGASVGLEGWRRSLQACGCTDESIARLASQTHWGFEREGYRLFPDVRALITTLIRTGVPLVLITNGASDTQRAKLHVLGIEPWFDVIVIAGEVGMAKPDPSVFGVALDQLVVTREDMWHVGDNLMTDVVGAQTAGLTAVWLNRSGRSRRDDGPEPDLEIRSLSNLMTWVAN